MSQDVLSKNSQHTKTKVVLDDSCSWNHPVLIAHLLSHIMLWSKKQKTSEREMWRIKVEYILGAQVSLFLGRPFSGRVEPNREGHCPCWCFPLSFFTPFFGAFLSSSSLQSSKGTDGNPTFMGYHVATLPLSRRGEGRSLWFYIKRRGKVLSRLWSLPSLSISGTLDPDIWNEPPSGFTDVGWRLSVDSSALPPA